MAAGLRSQWLQGSKGLKILSLVPRIRVRIQFGNEKRRPELRLSVGSTKLSQGHGSRVRFPPLAHGVQQWPQRTPERSNGVYHSRRRVGVDGTFNDSPVLQFAELLGERSLRDSGNTTFQFGESLAALEKLLENRGFPASADDTGGGFDGTQFWTISHTYLDTYCIPCCV